MASGRACSSKEGKGERIKAKGPAPRWGQSIGPCPRACPCPTNRGWQHLVGILYPQEANIASRRRSNLPASSATAAGGLPRRSDYPSSSLCSGLPSHCSSQCPRLCSGIPVFPDHSEDLTPLALPFDDEDDQESWWRGVGGFYPRLLLPRLSGAVDVSSSSRSILPRGILTGTG